MRRATLAGTCGALGAAVWAACGGGSAGTVAPARDAGGEVDAAVAVEAGAVLTPVEAETVSTRVDARGLLFAAGEMQLGGEPLAADYGRRDLGGYDATLVPPDLYLEDRGKADARSVLDLFGFSAAVESTQYARGYLDMVVSESGAGVSLADGPIVAQQTGATSFDRLRARMQALLTTAGADLAGYATLPAPAGNALDLLGFPGQWPAFLPFADWDPAMAPTLQVIPACTQTAGYGGLAAGTAPTAITPVYECDYNTTQLPARDAQVDKTVVPGVVGMAAWAESMAAIGFVGAVHDGCNKAVTQIAPSDLPSVGVADNRVLAGDPGACYGAFVGESALEGTWGVTMLEAVDNAAEWLLTAGLTSDGTTLGGFASRPAAMQYDYGSPLVWFPAAIAVVEDETVTPYPGLGSALVADPGSRAVDLAALLLGHAMAFGATDARNAGAGQRVGLRCLFDGAPFPADDGAANGEATLHDRALGVLRVALVDLDRMHVEPTLGVVMDAATVAGGVPTAGSTVTTTSLAHVLVALHQAVLALDGVIAPSGGPEPPASADAQDVFAPLPLHPPGAAGPAGVSARARQLFLANAAFVRDVLTRADGTVANGASITQGHASVTSDATSLESQTAAVRPLTEAYGLTGDASYQGRAQAVARRLIADFYGRTSRLFRQQAGGPDAVHMTSERFAWLQSALRAIYESAAVPGDPVLDRKALEPVMARVNKLFLNGWDDRNGNLVVDAPGECLQGRLQLGEQLSTGELGRDGLGRPVPDRDGDCVLELAHARSGSVQASDVLFHAAP